MAKRGSLLGTAAVVVLVLFACAFTASVSTAQEVPGRYIVVLRDEVPSVHDAVFHLAARFGIPVTNIYERAIKGFSIANVPPAFAAALARHPLVALVEPDLRVEAVAQTLPTGVNRIEADLNPVALNPPVDADIAILDTGAGPHGDLNVVTWVNFSGASSPYDLNGHGTHVAGIAAAVNNSFGVVGVAPGARVWSVKVLYDDGSGYLSDVIEGVDYVTANAAQIEVANMSLAGQGVSTAFRQAIQNSVAQGVVYVAAAGNSKQDVYGRDGKFGTRDDWIPAAYPEVCTVSAMVDTDGKEGGLGSSTSYGKDDTIASFSNYSRSVVTGNPVASPGKAVDVAAPGVNIYSTYLNNGYASLSGTSMAAPHVAGAAALWFAAKGRDVNGDGQVNASDAYWVRQQIIDSGQPQKNWRPPVNRWKPDNPASDPDGNLEPLVYLKNAPTP
jgi:subtilisin family serine protease